MRRANREVYSDYTVQNVNRTTNHVPLISVTADVCKPLARGAAGILLVPGVVQE